MSSRFPAALVLTALALLSVLAAAPAEGGGTSADACGVKTFSYAGLQARNVAHGVSATLASTRAPSVTEGHVGGWIGVGGTDAGPGGVAEWVQVGLAAFGDTTTSQMYYEVTVPGSAPRYVELGQGVRPGDSHRFSVLEMAHRPDWWRVWIDGKAVSPPIHLPGSDGTWHPQAVAENWNGGAGACNGFGYSFSDISLAQATGGSWRPLRISQTFQDPGYRVVPVSASPFSFVAASLAV